MKMKKNDVLLFYSFPPNRMLERDCVKRLRTLFIYLHVYQQDNFAKTEYKMTKFGRENLEKKIEFEIRPNQDWGCKEKHVGGKKSPSVFL